jgi:histone-lysine N-methyltransferase SETMAR
MNKKIDNPADCEARSVIRFLNAKMSRAIDIHRQLMAVYGEGEMNGSSVRKWCRMFNEGKTNVHDEERSGRPSLITEDLKRKQALLQEFGWEVFEHPAYSPDLTPSDFHLFPKLKEILGGRRFKSDEEVKDAVKEWLNGLAAEVCDEGIQKLVTRYDKCLNVGGDYVGK